MNLSAQLPELEFQPLKEENISAVYDFVTRNEHFYSMPIEFFHRGTLGDEGFNPDLSIIAIQKTDQIPIACIIGVKRNNSVVLKICLVDEIHRYKGLGTMILLQLMKQAKIIIPKRGEIRFGDSPPRYWTPGVDKRHTALIFFLEKHGFKRKGQRLNLVVDLSRYNQIPQLEKKGFHYSRLQLDELEQLQSFIKTNFNAGWAREASIGIENDPPTTFIAKDASGQIVGFSSCDLHFPGSFGPTGVKKSIRGGGIGGELLRWCCYTQKEKGIKECVIQWVGPTKFYSKIANAYMAYEFIVMKRKL
jgi:GNAT superfamily N-acetyltransferase